MSDPSYRLLVWSTGLIHRARRSLHWWMEGDRDVRACANCGAVVDHVFVTGRANDAWLFAAAVAEHAGPCGLPCANSPANTPENRKDGREYHGAAKCPRCGEA